MSQSHYFYLPLSPEQLSLLVEAHQKEFDLLLGDTFSEEELNQLEKQLDGIAAVYVQPILEELSFDDFYPDPLKGGEQKLFFESCRSCVLLENLPYLENNWSQVSYLRMLLERFSEVLIDRGGVSELQFKEDYLRDLKKYKDLSDLVPTVPLLRSDTENKTPVDPIDFLILDVFRELERINLAGLDEEIKLALQGQNEKVHKLYQAFGKERANASELFRRSTLSPKDFDDYLERLKFLLRKIK